MLRLMCKGKIHRAAVTEANLQYEGSITIDEHLMKAAEIQPYEIVQVTSLANAARWKTYAIPGAAHSGEICLNGPPAHLFHPGDIVIILSMGYFTEEELRRLTPKVIFVDAGNKITSINTHRLYNQQGEVNWHDLKPR